MGRRPKWGRPVDGVLVLNKDTGMTSNAALQQAKRLFFAKRAGHTGSLDPLATGVLPICFGESTKFSQYLLDADKRYFSTFRLGVKTETGDCDGDIIAETDAGHIDQAQVEAAISGFRGSIEQVPSMYSALKYQGKPFYQWAREGVTLPPEVRQPRQVTVFEYELLAFREAGSEGKGIKGIGADGAPGTSYPEVDVAVHCSKGTYIRTLAEDLGELLGCGAHVIRLHRQAAGCFTDSHAVSLEQLSEERGEARAEILDHHLLPVDAPVQAVPRIEVTADMAAYFRQGQPVMNIEAYRLAKEGGMVRVCLEGGQFLGIGELVDGNVAPRRIVNY